MSEVERDSSRPAAQGDAPAPRSRGLRGGAAIAAAMGVMNVATYGYTVLVAHLIGREEFGAFSAMMGLTLVINVVSLGLQATGARRIAADPDHVLTVERTVLGVTYRSALGLAVLCLVAAPVLHQVLRLDSLATAALLAVTAMPLTIMGGQAGILQGERRWVPLAGIYLALGVGRLVFGLVLVAVWPTEFAAFLGVALGAWLPVVVGYVALRRPRAGSVPLGDHPSRDVLGEVGRNSQALFAFFALSNVDIVLARALLSESQAGLYAGGLILVKATLFLPQFLVILVFPAMSSRGADRGTLLKALGVTSLLGLAGVGGVLLLPDFALLFVGGDDFAGLRDDLWLFAIIGTLLSMLQLLVYSVLARQQLGASAMLWTALVLVSVVAALTVGSVIGLALLVVAVDGVLLLGLALTAWLIAPRR